MGEHRMLRTAAGWTAACALTAGLLTACGSSGGQQAAGAGTSASSSPAPTAVASAPAETSTSGMPATTTMIMIEQFAYATPPKVAPGSHVQVMNMDGEAHTVTADSGNAFDVPSPAGQTVTFTAPTTPGSYPFHCTYHGNMHGVLVVG